MNNIQAKNIRDFRNLKVWQNAMDLSDSIYEVANNFPKFEEYAMKTQITRSATSIAANIAEGNAQQSLKRELNHINIAIGSATETRSWIITALRQEYITQEQHDKVDLQINEIIKMLYGYRKKLNMYIENETDRE